MSFRVVVADRLAPLRACRGSTAFLALDGSRPQRLLAMSSIGGTSTTMKIVGRMRNTSGISSLTGVFCAAPPPSDGAACACPSRGRA